MRKDSAHVVLAVLLGVFAAILFGACGGKESARGMRLPEGNVENGRKAFVQLNCIQCHTVVGEDLAAAAQSGPIQLELGGQVLRVKTYGELITSIINPVHVVSPKFKAMIGVGEAQVAMPDFTSQMTVRQMLDLVAFLQTGYRLSEPDYFPY